MAGHHDQVELPIPGDRGEVAEDPLDVRARTRLVEHRGSGVESTQPSCVTALTGLVQQRTRPATNIEHGLRGHEELQVEVEVVSLHPAEGVIQRGESGFGEVAIDHRTYLPGPRRRRNDALLP